MSRRNHTFAVDEYYHCYNRGTDKRVVFADKQDYNYFLESIDSYNSNEAFGKLRLHQKSPLEDQIVEVVAYCLLPNHFHMVLKERVEGGISKYMQRIGISYTLYFNEKNNRSGALFQGAFKSKEIGTDQDLRQVISYVTHNNIVHDITNKNLYRSKLSKEAEIVRVPNSNFSSPANMLEIVDIIKLLRLAFD
jgi:REP element-mobilizing transposase RayT